jgi:hypothetical protein
MLKLHCRSPFRPAALALAGFGCMILLATAPRATAAPLYFSTSSNLVEITPTAATNPASNGTTITSTQINGGFAVTPNGVIYTNNGGTIAKLASNGTVINSSLVTGLSNAQELMAQGEDFWVVQNSPLQATRYNSVGTLQQTINLSVMSSGSRAMSIDSAGNYYFINTNQIFKYTSAGNWAGLFTTTTGTLFDIAIDSNDNILVTSSIGNIYKTDTSLTTPTSYITGLNTPRGLAFDDQDNLYVLNSFSNQIRLYNSTGTLVEADYVYGITPSGGGNWLTVAPVPEPNTLALAAIAGVAGLASLRLRRRKHQA